LRLIDRYAARFCEGFRRFKPLFFMWVGIVREYADNLNAAVFKQQLKALIADVAETEKQYAFFCGQTFILKTGAQGLGSKP